MVAPYPFFGCPMRFQDDFAALQITDDGRFSFSDVSLVEQAAEADASPTRTKVGDARRVLTYEGVFTAAFTPPSEDDDPQATRRARTPRTPKRAESTRRLRTPGSPTRPESAKARDGNAEEPQPGSEQVAAIEATALVKHEMIETAGRSRLVAVERGAFRFAITVSPFFNPVFANVKLLPRNPSPGHPAPRGRRLPFVGAGGPLRPPAGSGSPAVELRPRRRPAPGGPFKKHGRSAAILPSVDASPFRRAAAGSLASPQGVGGLGLAHRRHSGCASTPHFRVPRPDSDWVDFYRERGASFAGH